MFTNMNAVFIVFSASNRAAQEQNAARAQLRSRSETPKAQ
jgi:hypothetical protein